MTATFVQDPESAAGLRSVLSSTPRIALDCEAAGFHRYSDRLCLLQLSDGSEDFLFDTLAFNPAECVHEVLEDRDVTVVVHGGDYDLRLIDRDLGIRPRNLFDTRVAAALLGEPALGLAALVERLLGLVIDKKHQKADWARRPLPVELREYAAHDVRHLIRLADVLSFALREQGRMAWAQEEFAVLEGTRWVPADEEDPVTRVKGARRLKPRALLALREALEWRDDIARDLDRAPFRVAGNQALLAIAVERPRELEALSALPGVSTSLVRRRGRELLERLERVAAVPEAHLVRNPTRSRTRSERPSPEVQQRADCLKELRNAAAERLGIDRGTLLPNGVLMDLAQRIPILEEELSSIDGLRSWQISALGDPFLDALTRFRRTDSAAGSV